MTQSQVHEERQLHDAVEVFDDRKDAGRKLGKMLESRYGRRDDVAVLAIPAGGVPVALEVRRMLGASFDLIIARKLKIPGNPEAGFGAVSFGEDVFLNQALLSELDLDEEDVEAEITAVKAELDSRNHRFRDGRGFPDLKGRVAILVDDGLASGYTMLSSIHMVKTQQVKRTVVAVPTAPLRTIEKIRPEVDEIYCPNIREGMFFAVADAYASWYDLKETEVVDLLKKGVDRSSWTPELSS